MLEQTKFVIYKSDSRYSITECSDSGVRQVFVTEGGVTGDQGVLLRLSQMKPREVSIQAYLEKNAGSIITEEKKAG